MKTFTNENTCREVKSDSEKILQLQGDATNSEKFSCSGLLFFSHQKIAKRKGFGGLGRKPSSA